MIDIPRESQELLKTTVTVDGAPVTNYQVAVTTSTARPTVWDNPVVVDGVTGPLVGPMPPGLYTVWARVQDSPEVPVVKCGQFRVT